MPGGQDRVRSSKQRRANERALGGASAVRAKLIVNESLARQPRAQRAAAFPEPIPEIPALFPLGEGGTPELRVLNFS